MATAKTTLNRPRGPALIPPQTPPGTTTQPPTHATFCAPLFILIPQARPDYRKNKERRMQARCLGGHAFLSNAIQMYFWQNWSRRCVTYHWIEYDDLVSTFGGSRHLPTNH